MMAMPGAGDLVLYGIGARGGEVPFLDERGSPTELHPYILHPPTVTLPEAPLFAAYRDGTAA